MCSAKGTLYNDRISVIVNTVLDSFINISPQASTAVKRVRSPKSEVNVVFADCYSPRQVELLFQRKKIIDIARMRSGITLARQIHRNQETNARKGSCRT